MKRPTTLLLTGVWIALLFMVVACGEEAPPQPQAQAVSKKIATAPSAPEGATPQEAPKATLAGPNAETDSEQIGAGATVPPGAVDQSAPGMVAVDPPADSDASLTEEIAAAEPSELIKASLEMASTYDPTDRFDPFEPLFKEQPEVEAPQAESLRRERRVPQTPLERVALSQLKVTAIIRSPSGNRALVEDATGRGYVVTPGTYIGLNSGQVIEIDAGRIVVEEEIETIMGELKIQIAEIKLQKPPGEL